MGALDEIYPKLFETADRVFPEFQFQAHASGWIAAAKRDLDGSETKQGGKVYIYRDRPYRLWSHRMGEGLSFWGYLAQRDGFNPQDSRAVLQHLAELAGISLKSSQAFGWSATERSLQNLHQQPILTAAALWMEQALTRSEATSVRTYLREQRGYSTQEIVKMQLGFLPSQLALEQHLLGEGYGGDRVTHCLKMFGHALGRSHQLMISVRSRRGQVIGFCGRTVIPTLEPKYLNTKGLDKTAALFDYPFGCEHLVLVEGVLDAAIAQAKGMQNVVPLHGSSLSLAQLKQLQGEGIGGITLCLDSDRAGAQARKRIIERVLTQIPQMRLRIAILPQGCDPDDIIRTAGIEAFQKRIERAEGVGAYCGRRLAEQIRSRQFTAGVRDRLLQRCAKIERGLIYPPDRYDFQQRLQTVLETRMPPAVYEQTLLHLQEQPSTNADFYQVA